MYVKVAGIWYALKRLQKNVLTVDHGFWKRENVRKTLLK